MSTLKKSTIFGYKLTPKQDICLNYLFPTIASYLLYIFLIACDIALIYSLHKSGDKIWASLTLFFIYLPIIGSYIIVMSSYDLWPDPDDCTLDNLMWAIWRTLQHFCFPLWSTWRYAERLFWCIEALRDEEIIEKAKSIINGPRTVELYFFLQAYIHSLPQIILQTQLLFITENRENNSQTIYAQVLSIVLNLYKVSVVTTYYQRFKSQKLTGRQYPWFKKETQNEDVNLRDNNEEPRPTEHRRSSDFYLEPNEILSLPRSISVVDGPERRIYTEPDFSLKRLVYVKALPEDDLAGKVVSFFWWFTFLLARILAISAFGYFYKSGLAWMLSLHFIFVMSYLLYDAQIDGIKRSKTLFFIFLGIIYIFCIIEFKIRFKKVKYIYMAYFGLVYLENLIMCLIWWFNNMDDLQNDFWFKYTFFLIVMCSLFSICSMFFYLLLIQPKKIVVGTRML